LSWAERVAAIGHGDRRPMTSQGALAVASAATSSTGTVADRDDPIGRQPGQRVTVTPDDTGRDPVVGELVASGPPEEIVDVSASQTGKYLRPLLQKK